MFNPLFFVIFAQLYRYYYIKLMYKKFTFIIALFTSAVLSAQKNVEVGLFLGASNYTGDMTESRFQEMNFAGGLILRYNPNPNISVRGNVFYGTINGDDKNFSDKDKQRRNLNFTSPLFEFSGQIEWNLFGFDAIGTKGKRGFTPYIFGGVGIFKFNPKTKLDGEWVELQPLGTEGQGTTPLQDRKKYALTQASLPFGVGIKFRLAPRFVVGIEYGPRFTFTDYLDDVSLTYVNPAILQAQYGDRSRRLSNRTDPFEEKGPYDVITQKGQARGDRVYRDWYTFTGVTLTYTISLQRVRCYQF